MQSRPGHTSETGVGWGRGEHSSRGERAWTGPESQTELFWPSPLSASGDAGDPAGHRQVGATVSPGGWLLPLSYHVTFVILSVCASVSSSVNPRLTSTYGGGCKEDR